MAEKKHAPMMNTKIVNTRSASGLVTSGSCHRHWRVSCAGKPLRLVITPSAQYRLHT